MFSRKKSNDSKEKRRLRVDSNLTQIPIEFRISLGMGGATPDIKGPDGSGRSQFEPSSHSNNSNKLLGNMLKLVAICAVICGAFAQNNYNYAQNELTTPYPRNYHPPAPVHYVNIGQDLAGDYKFGYDTGKGPLGQSFREETRLPDGTVKGAYGILDDQGRQRIIRYTAGKSGFVAEGDLGPNGAPGVAPGPAPQPVANPHAAAPVARSYQPAPQQYSPPQQSYQPAPQQYQPAPQQYRAAPAARYNDGQWDPRKDDPYYQDGPAFIDVDRLSYNIGTAKQG